MHFVETKTNNCKLAMITSESSMICKPLCLVRFVLGMYLHFVSVFYCLNAFRKSCFKNLPKTSRKYEETDVRLLRTARGWFFGPVSAFFHQIHLGFSRKLKTFSHPLSEKNLFSPSFSLWVKICFPASREGQYHLLYPDSIVPGTPASALGTLVPIVLEYH